MNPALTVPTTHRPSRGVLIAGLAWLFAYLAARFALETMAPPPHWDIAVANIPIVAFFWFVWVVRRTLNGADELRRRIHLEALALAFVTTLLVLMTLGLLDNPPSGPLGIPLRDLWIVMPVVYGLCFAAVNQRYR
jgi:hypothetical protein